MNEKNPRIAGALGATCAAVHTTHTKIYPPGGPPLVLTGQRGGVAHPVPMWDEL